jgi:glycosyltransferase involved in cell wall biosynthesis
MSFKDLRMSVNTRPRVLLLIPHLGGGGAERITSLLARGLCKEKYELHLGVITQAQAGAVQPPVWVHTHTFGVPRVRSAAFRIIRLVRRLKPDLILSGMAHLNFLVLLLRPFFPSGTRVLVRQNATVSASLASGELPGYTRQLYRLLYPRADQIICQSQSMADDMARELGLARNLLTVLPNPVDVETIRTSMALQDPEKLYPEDCFTAISPGAPKFPATSLAEGKKSDSAACGHGPHLLAVGRLSREKGFDLLLRALASVRKEFPDASLLIAGSGPEEAALKAECSALKLDEAVRFAGPTDRPCSLFPAATLFVLPSRHEGLPNALLEAAAGGLPIVALPASGGVVELLRNQPGVWLAPTISEDALAASLLAALGSLRPDERFAHPFVEAFRLDRALHAYERLIDQALEQGRKN